MSRADGAKNFQTLRNLFLAKRNVQMQKWLGKGKKQPFWAKVANNGKG